MPLNAGCYANLDDLSSLRHALRGRRLKAQQKLWAQLSGSHHAVQKGRGMEFSEVRQYQPGDDVRTIDWRVTARTQKPHTKVYIEEQERPVILCLQQTPDLFFGSHIRFKSVQALQVAALFAWLTLQHNDQIGGYLFNQQIHHWTAPKHHHSHVLRLLQQGLDLQQQLKQPESYHPQLWEQHLKQLQKAVKPGCQLILIGDLLSFSPSALRIIHQLKRQHDLIACHIYDRLEADLPHLGSVKLTDGTNELQIDSETPDMRQQYRDSYQQRFQNIRQQLLAFKIPVIALRADADPVAELMQQGVLL